MRLRAPLAAAVTLVCTAGVSPAAEQPNDQWASLRRPLHLPHVAAGAACPISRVDTRVPWARINIFGGSGIGAGPVYPGLGGSSGLISATRDDQYPPWFGEKVFWYVLPSYRGPALIRGRRVDGRGTVRFAGARRAAAELRIGPYDSVGWQGQPSGSRGIASGVLVLASGCYAFQIDGTTFSRVVVFNADVVR
jgi:hypothetical protein